MRWRALFTHSDRARLDSGDKGGVRGNVAIGHARGAEGETGIAAFIEENQATGALAAFGEELDGSLCSAMRTRSGGTQKIGGRFGKNYFHDGFTVAGRGNAASFGVSITTAANERRIADAAGEFTAGAPGGSGGEEAAVYIHRDSTHSALFVAPVMPGGMGIFAAAEPGFALGGRDEFLWIAKRDAVLRGKALGAFGDEHHVRAFFKNRAGQADGILDAVQPSDGTGTKSGRIHDDCIAFDLTVEIEMRTIAGVEDGIVLKSDDGGFDGVEGVAVAGDDRPAGLQCAAATILAGLDGFIWDVPGTTVNDERWRHKE